jgi:DNA-binding CsgD family transcriptional regulator
MVGASLSRKTSLVYFSVLGAVFLAYGLVIIWANVSTWSRSRFIGFSFGFILVQAALVVGALVSGLSGLFRRALVMVDEKRRQAVRIFGGSFLLAHSAALVLSPYAYRSGWRSAGYVACFFCANLIPLLYWRSYLEDYGRAAPASDSAADAMARFIAEYKISRREEEVIRELCSGKTNKEIAKSLYISVQTVKDHIYRIYLKTNVNNRVQLINLVQSSGRREDARTS